MRPSYDRPEPTQATFPNVVGEHVDGQLELHEPGPRVDVDAVHTRELEVDPRQCYLPGVLGVRTGAQWCRESASCKVAMVQLDLWRAAQHKRRGRVWSETDLAMATALQLRSWGVVELGHRKTVIPEWMRGEVLDTPNGELVLTHNPRARQILAWAWSAFEAGTFGVLLTRDQWAEVLGCSPRSVHNYMRELEAKGLIRRMPTMAPARVDGEIIPGSWDAAVLVRIGTGLDCIALAAFERRHVRYPRRSGIRRHAARELAQALRCSSRDRGRALQHERRALRLSWQQRSDSTHGGAAAPSSLPCMAKNANLPAPPPTELESGLGWSAQGAAGAPPQDPSSKAAGDRSTADAVRSPAPRPDGTAPHTSRELQPPCFASAPAPSTISTSTTTATLERDRAASRRRAPAQGAAPRKRTWQDAAAELGRTLNATGNRDAADSVVEALASIGIAVELEAPPRPSDAAWFASEHDARVGAALQPAVDELVEDLAGRVVDDQGAAYRTALERLELEHRRDLPLFAQPSRSSSSSSSSSPPSADAGATEGRGVSSSSASSSTPATPDRRRS